MSLSSPEQFRAQTETETFFIVILNDMEDNFSKLPDSEKGLTDKYGILDVGRQIFKEVREGKNPMDQRCELWLRENQGHFLLSAESKKLIQNYFDEKNSQQAPTERIPLKIPHLH